MTNRTLAGTHAGANEVSLSDTSSPLPGQGQGGTPPENPRFESAPAGELENPGFNSATIFPAVPEAGGEGRGGREFNDQDVVDSAEAPTSPSSSPNGFEALGLSPLILKAVAESGYTTPTPIQAQGIPEVLKRRDIIGIAQTGTGKTASFTLPMIELLARGRAKARMPRSLILEPTRELAAQVAESFERYGKHNKLSMALLIGGTSFDDQEKKLDRGVDVLIATPGRLLDHFERGKLMLSQVQILVIDEADRMLDMGFIPDVERICKLIPFTRQTLFYSATMPPEIQRLTDQFLHHPVRVEVSRPATTADNIVQEAIDIPASDWAKREALRRLIRDNGVKNAIVFCTGSATWTWWRSRSPSTGSTPRRCMATSTSPFAPARSMASAAGRSSFWWRPTWRRAASTFRPSATSSISTRPIMPTTTCIASAAPAAPAAPAMPTCW